MYRRTLIGAAGVGTIALAGCLMDGSPSDDNDDEPAGGSEGTTDHPSVDEPPQDIEEPDIDGDEEWNDHYLGENIEESPSLEFSMLEGSVEESPIEVEPDDTQPAYAVDVLTDEEAIEDRVDLNADVAVEADEVLAVVHSGFGSSSVRHQWVRAEEIDDGIHLHGYYTDPQVQTHDYTTRHSIVSIQTQDEDPTVTVSLTVSADQRVTFDSSQEYWRVDGA